MKSAYRDQFGSSSTARDGGSFDIRTFHDAVLGPRSLPLATFACELPAWVVAPA